MSAEEIRRAKLAAEQARARFAATAAELQARLRPGTLANNAWEGVKDKGSELADDAVQAVKGRPRTVSAVLAVFTLFLAREPIRSAIGRLFRDDEDENGVTTRLDETDEKFDLTAPVAERSRNEGVSA
jgi:hypothetical protein